MQNSKLNRIILVTAGLAVIVVFILYYFVYQGIKSKNEHISSLSNDLSSQGDKQDYLISTQRIIQGISSDIDRINNSIIAKDGDVGFIENLESLAREVGLTMEIDSLVLVDNPEFASSSIVTLKIRAQVSGNWVGTYRFLAQLESLPLKIKINKFDLRNTTIEISPDVKKSGSSNNVWQSAFEIDVLRYK